MPLARLSPSRRPGARAPRIAAWLPVVAGLLGASGCAVGPCPPGERTLTHDVASYLSREWPLSAAHAAPYAAAPADGVPVEGVPVEGGKPASCGTDDGNWIQGPSAGCPSAVCPSAGCGGTCYEPQRVYADDWDQPGSVSQQAKPEPIPAVPLEVGPPSRFFPVPVRPAFAPQDAGMMGPSHGGSAGPPAAVTEAPQNGAIPMAS